VITDEERKAGVVHKITLESLKEKEEYFFRSGDGMTLKEFFEVCLPTIRKVVK